MIRTILMTVAVGCCALTASLAQALTLRDQVVASGETVKAGDFFADAGVDADVPLFQAPSPGTGGGVSAMRLSQAVRAIGLIWSPTDPNARITVSRASEKPDAQIGTAEIVRAVSNAILDAIPEVDSEQDLAISLSDDPGPLVLPAAGPYSVSIAKLDLNRQARRFQAIVEVSQAGHREQHRIHGRYDVDMPIPVLARPVARGEILTANDITFERMGTPGARTLMDADNITGMAARRPLRAGQTFTANDLEAPRVVTRNQLVTVVFELPGLQLTTQGRALADAAVGDSISVVNVRSKRIVQAVARGPGRVAVGSDTTHLAMR